MTGKSRPPGKTTNEATSGDPSSTTRAAPAHLTRDPREIAVEKHLAARKASLEQMAEKAGLGSLDDVAATFMKVFANDPSGRPYAAGDFYGFHCLPANRFSPPERPRFAAIRVFVVDPAKVVAAVLDGVFDHPPSLDEVKDLPILRLQRYSSPGEVATASISLQRPRWSETDPPPDLEFRFLGNVPPGAAEVDPIGRPRRESSWTGLSREAEHEWRWQHDRERLASEIERERSDRDNAWEANAWRELPERIRGGESALHRWMPPTVFTRRKKSARPFAAGDYYGFRTVSPFGYPPPDRPRYGAVRILAVEPGRRNVTTVSLDGIFDTMPTLAEASALKPMKDRRRSVLQVSLHTVDPRLELYWLGNTPLREEETSWYASLEMHEKPYGPWSFVGSTAETEWRSRNDREALDADTARVTAERHEADVADAVSYRAWRKRLTWNALLTEEHFARWNRSPPFPPAAFTTAARETINRTIRAIALPGRRLPSEDVVRAALRECVQWFNVENARAGDVIETEERDDILQVLANICYVARQRALNEEIDQWRTW